MPQELSIFKFCTAAALTLTIALLLGGCQDGNAQKMINVPTATNTYNLSFLVNVIEESVTFEIYGNTTGYIGFGFTNISGMVQADIFMGGVFENGTSYSGVHD